MQKIIYIMTLLLCTSSIAKDISDEINIRNFMTQLPDTPRKDQLTETVKEEILKPKSKGKKIKKAKEIYKDHHQDISEGIETFGYLNTDIYNDSFKADDEKESDELDVMALPRRPHNLMDFVIK